MTLRRRTYMLTLALLVGCVSARAAETHLICQGTEERTIRRSAGEHTDPQTGQVVQETVRIPSKSEVIHEIRFDEEAKTFWYRGNQRIGHMKAQDGWVPAALVVFGDRTIDVSFDRTLKSKARAVLSFGIDLIVNAGATNGQLDRYSGVWRIGDLALTCSPVDLQQRRF